MVPSFRSSSGPITNQQSFYDRTGVDSVRSQVERRLSSTGHRASFLGATVPHSGDWLLALPISSCGLRLDDEAVREWQLASDLASIYVNHTLVDVAQWSTLALPHHPTLDRKKRLVTPTANLHYEEQLQPKLRHDAK